MEESEESKRLRRAMQSNQDWESRQIQDFDPARARQASLDAIQLIGENQVVFMQIQAFHREAAHPGNPDVVQRKTSQMWLDATKKSLSIAKRKLEEYEKSKLEAIFNESVDPIEAPVDEDS